jgi:hypothetical protein
MEWVGIGTRIYASNEQFTAQVAGDFAAGGLSVDRLDFSGIYESTLQVSRLLLSIESPRN